jgi:hypothetical protein
MATDAEVIVRKRNSAGRSADDGDSVTLLVGGADIQREASSAGGPCCWVSTSTRVQPTRQHSNVRSKTHCSALPTSSGKSVEQIWHSG